MSLAKGEKYPIHVTYLEHVAGTGRFSVPWNTPHATAASDAQLSYLCFNTLVTEPSDKSSSEFYQRVAGDRIARWKSGEATVGEWPNAVDDHRLLARSWSKISYDISCSNRSPKQVASMKGEDHVGNDTTEIH